MKRLIARIGRRGRRLTGALAVAVAGGVLVCGCQFQGVSSLPLPGGVDTGPGSYTIKVEFGDVLDLVPQSVVKVDDVTVGKVEDIRLVGWHAVVTCRLKKSVDLPENAVAKIEQTSLLGEKFVALMPPVDEPPRGRLHQGDVITLPRTGESAEIEQVLSAMSMLLNEGGLEQISTITDELNAALGGREDKIRDVLNQIDTFVGAMNSQKSQIVRAIDNLDKLTARLRAQQKTIGDTIDQVTPAIAILAQQRKDLTRLLVSMSKLGTVADQVIGASKADTLANLRSLRPVLANLAQAGDDIPKALELALTFPFPKTAERGIKGDYTNLFVTVDLSTADVLHNLLTGTALQGAAGIGDVLGRLTPPSRVPQLPPLGVLPDTAPAPSPGQAPGSPTPSPSPSATRAPLGGLLGGLADGPPPGDEGLATLLMGGAAA